MTSADRVLRLTLAYDGTHYHGWQRQPRADTVAGRLMGALEAVTGERRQLLAAGRTDAGAHAGGQVVAVALARDWAPDQLLVACNRELPQDIRVTKAEPAAVGFDPRREAWRRTYRYLLRTGPGPRPRGCQYSWAVPTRLELAPMRAAAASLLGRHDFGSFGRSPVPGGSTVRLLDRAGLAPTPTGLRMELRGDAFLRGMVRGLVGALVAVGSGRLGAGEFSSLVDCPRPGAAAHLSAPAHGLHLWNVEYGDRHPEVAAA